MYSFFKHRFWFFGLSAAILLSGLIVALVFGVELDITFKGGSILKYSYTGTVDLNKADDAISAAIHVPVSCQKTTSLGDDRTNLVINVAGNKALMPEEQTALQDALAEEFPNADFKLVEQNSVNPFIGRELLTKGIWAIIVASILIVAYVWFSFRRMSGPSAGVMALVALYHDVLVSFFVFVFMRTPLNESLIAVVLTILGFSINDTIIIYDRIRENERLLKGSIPLSDLVDLSIRQSLTRSINTSLCTWGAVLVAYIFAVIYGIDSIKEFALPMLIGIISGSYSTIFLAGPLWVMWKTRKGRTGY